MAVADPAVQRRLAGSLAAMTSREAAVELLNGFTVPELRVLGDAWGHPIGAVRRKADAVGFLAEQACGAPPASPPARSSEPLRPNAWGGIADVDAVNVHPDGYIPTAVARMGSDAYLDVTGDGRALGNVLNELASAGVQGRVTAGEQVAELHRLRDRTPEDSRARVELGYALSRLDVPAIDPPDLPDGTPEPLRRLVAELVDVPLIRDDPSKLGRLTEAAGRFAAGDTGGLRLISEVRDLRGLLHESQEGYFQTQDAVTAAVRDLRAIHQADRTQLYPRPKPDPVDDQPVLEGAEQADDAGPVWQPDGTGVVDNGDVGGDGQVGAAPSVRYAHPDQPGSTVTVSYYADDLSAYEPYGDNGQQPPPEYAVSSTTEYRRCTDPNAPDTSEVWSDATYATLPDRYPTAELAEAAATRAAEQHSPAGIDWTGLAPHESPDPTTAVPAHPRGPSMSVTFETAKQFLGVVNDLAGSFAQAAERGCADLASAGLPQQDLAHAAAIGDAAATAGRQATAAYTGLVHRHQTAQQAYDAAGGAPHATSWHGAN